MSVSASGEDAGCRHDASWCPRLCMNRLRCNCRFMAPILGLCSLSARVPSPPCGLCCAQDQVPGIERVLLIAELVQDHAEARERAEMPRFAHQHLADVFDRVGEILLHVVDGSAPVPGLDVIWPDVEDGIEQLDREIVILGVDCGLD